MKSLLQSWSGSPEEVFCTEKNRKKKTEDTLTVFVELLDIVCRYLIALLSCFLFFFFALKQQAVALNVSCRRVHIQTDSNVKKHDGNTAL